MRVFKSRVNPVMRQPARKALRYGFLMLFFASLSAPWKHSTRRMASRAQSRPSTRDNPREAGLKSGTSVSKKRSGSAPSKVAIPVPIKAENMQGISAE